MKRRAPCLLLSLLVAASSHALDVRLSVQPGGAMPDLAFEELANSRDYGALGLKVKQGGFRLSDVKSDLLVLEFFNQLCMHCQRQAPFLQTFYEAAAKGELPGRVAVLTVGVGNRLAELRDFRSRYRVSYPIAADPNFDLFMEMGDPGGTPLTLFLLRRDAGWVLADSHMGLAGDTELLARARVLLKGGGGIRGAGTLSGAAAPGGRPSDRQAEGTSRARKVLSQVSGRDVEIDFVDLQGVRVCRALGADGTATGLYARIARREPVCDVCHAIQFVIVFDRSGTVRGFEPVYVTKYGNEEWTPDDASKMRARLTGRKMKGLSFEPRVDAVTSATMSSSLIFDEARRSAALLDALGKR